MGIEPLSVQIRSHLLTVSTTRLPLTYKELVDDLALRPPNTIHQVAEGLEQLMSEDAAQHRPFIAAFVISRARSGLPAPGFFDAARSLGRLHGTTEDDHADFFESEFCKALGFWRAAEAELKH